MNDPSEGDVLYEMEIKVSGLDINKVVTVVTVLEHAWPEGKLTAPLAGSASKGNTPVPHRKLSGRGWRSEEWNLTAWVECLVKEIYEANGNYCQVTVYPSKYECTSSPDCKFGRGDYARLMNIAPMLDKNYVHKVKTKGNLCPFCWSTFVSDCVDYMSCGTCDKKWQNVMTLMGYKEVLL